MATEIDPALIAQINYEFERYGHMLPDTYEKYVQAAAAVKDFQLKMDLTTKAAGALYQTFTTYNRAVYDGIKGYKDLASTTDALATSIEAVTAAIAWFTPMGKIAKGVTVALGLLAGEATRFSKVIGEQADNVRKGFDGLAEIGATAGDGMQGVFEGIQRLGLGVQDADHMIRLLGENADTVSLFGGTMKQGSRVFENTVDSMKPMAADFLSLGIQFKDFSTVGMNYLRVQKQMTMGTKQQMDTSAEAVKRYVEEMDEVTRLTGLSRKKQEELLEDAYREEAFAAKMDDLRDKAADARAKGQTAEADRLDNAVKMYEAGLIHAAATSKEMAEAYKTGVSGFVGNSDKSIALFQASNGKIQELNNNIERGAVRNEKELAMQFKGVNQAVGEFGKTFRQNYMAKAMGGFGVSLDTSRRALQRASMSDEEYAKTLDKAETERIEQMGKTGTQEELLARSNQLLIRSNAEMLKSQKAIQDMMPGYMRAIEGTTSTMDKLRDAAMSAAEALGIIGGKKKGGADRNIPGSGTSTAGGVGSVESQRTQTAKMEREAVEMDLENARLERERLEKEKGRGDEETKKARIREAELRREAEKARAAEEHMRHQQSRSMGVSGGAATSSAGTATEVNLGAGNAPGVKISKADGTEELRTGGTKSWRNNNPGNIRAGNWASSQGAIGQSGGMAVFPDVETGNRARENLLFGGGDRKYVGATIASAMEMYAPRSENDTAKYIAEIVKATGVAANTPLASLTPEQKSKMLDIMKQHEGWQVGKVETTKKDDKPRLADGGIVKANPGGTEVIVGEAGVSEAVIPLKSGAVPVTITGADAGMSALGMFGGSAGKLVNGLDTLVDKELTWAEKVVEVVKTVNPTIRVAAALYDTVKNVNAAYSAQTSLMPEVDLAKKVKPEPTISETSPGASSAGSNQIEVVNALKESVEVNKAMVAMMAEMVQQQKNSNNTQEKMLQVAQN